MLVHPTDLPRRDRVEGERRQLALAEKGGGGGLDARSQLTVDDPAEKEELVDVVELQLTLLLLLVVAR